MKTIFLDVDGTLIDYKHNLPESASVAVRQARACGNLVYLATGRCKAEIYDELSSIGFDGMICANGMYIESGGTIIRNKVIEPSLAKKALVWLTDRRCGYYYQSPDGLFADEQFRSCFLKSNGVQIHPEMQFISSDKMYPVEKINFLLHQGILDEAYQLFGDQLQVSSWSGSGIAPEFGEFSVPGMNKADAIASLIAKLGVERADTIAFGDAESDIGMIEYCGTGVAMGNALPLVKTYADFTTASVMEDGILKAFRQLEVIPAGSC